MRADAVPVEVLARVTQLLEAHRQRRQAHFLDCLPQGPWLADLRAALVMSLSVSAPTAWLPALVAYVEEAEHPLAAIPPIEVHLREAVAVMIEAVGQRCGRQPER